MRNQDGQHDQPLKRVPKSSIPVLESGRARDFIKTCIANLDKRHPDLSRQYRIANDILEHRIYGTDLVRFMTPALAHITTDGCDPDITVFSVDGNSIGLSLPTPFWPWTSVDGQGYIIGIDDSAITAHYDMFTHTFRIMDRTKGVAIHWIMDMHEIPLWERSFPLRTLISWWFRDTDLQPIHSAAVGIDGKAALITAKGGSGKSNTALRSLLAGMDYLGDDFVIVDTSEAKVFSLYNVVKLTRDDLKAYNALKLPADKITYNDQDKSQIFLSEIYGDHLVHQATLSYILVPSITENPGAKVTAISHDHVLDAMSLSTLYLLKNSANQAVSKMKTLVSTIPCLRLELGQDRDSAPAIIKDLLTGGV